VPLVGGSPSAAGPAHRIVEPAFHGRVVGTVREAQAAEVERAAILADQAYPHWSAQGALFRARILERAADLLVDERDRFLTLLVREGGRTLRNAVGEWREAVDFLRYYAAEATRLMVDRPLPGPTGESNVLRLAGKGVFVCISPWNFPLSIFLGQVAAALATGNTVLAKPAGETPLVAFEAVGLLHRAGIPADVLHYLPGGGDVGATAVAQPQVRGVVFTGSTATARRIATVLAGKDGPLVPLIAETGGQNAMIVDSSALLEQAAGDIVASAFDSAGQRCSALRVLAVQEDVADALIALVKGAMATLALGDPALPATDIGPLIHDRAREALQAHLREAASYGTDLSGSIAVPDGGSFFAPRLIEIDAISSLTREVFGPVLHVVRWQAGGLETLIGAINATGYGLTLAVETRLPSTIETVKRLARVGNLYVNRSQIGAVVGSQPFGGEGLSGTGPKAGGPHYLTRFVTERTMTVNTAATGGNAELLRGE
jgi:RHH-type proline utilization regulon transcriptional repressor/proline dehydrogenase/delta 1-pyrroline-5-carboxylate dehydrogenase